MSRSSVVRPGLATALIVAAAVAFPHARQLASRPPETQIQSLEAPGRVAAQKVDAILARLDLQPGLIIADIGAGTGVFARPLARGVGPTGKVYAVDIVPELLAYLDDRARQEQLTNIQSVLGVPDDPKLPARNIDIAVFNDVLHHIEHRQAYLKSLASYMKPDSLMAIVEFDKSRSPTGLIEGVPMVDKAELTGWLAELGFRPSQEYSDLFPSKWYVIYARGTAGDRLRHMPVTAEERASPRTTRPASTLRPGEQNDPRLSEGTGSLSGVVIDRVSGQPVPDASVSISLNGGGGARRSATTESDGTFGFDGVSSGSLYISVSKRGYSTGMYGRSDPYGPGGPTFFELDEGEDVPDLVLHVAKQGVMRGRVLDEQAQPVQGATVQLRRLSTADGRSYLGLGSQVRTDRDGMYEIPTINAGRYLISVPVFPYGFGSPTANLTAFDRATIYYPGTLAADDATVVEVGAGAEIDGIVVRLPALQTVAVSGRVQGLSLSGPANVELLFDETDRIVTATPVFVTRLASDGAFQFPRVPAGQYVVRVRHLARVVGSAGFQTVTQSISLGGGGAFGVGRGGPLAPMSDAPSYWATVPVAVGQTNVEGVEIVVRPGARIRGTVEFRGATPPEGDALNATGLMLTGGRMQDVPAFQVTRLETDGSFVTAGLPPGRYVPNFMPDIAGGMLRGWQLESITAGGRAVAAMELGTTDLQDVRLTFVDTPATVAGVVRDAAGSPVMGAFVHVFPVNRDVTPAFLGSVRTLSSSRRGAFEATLPSGEYFVVAALEPDADPDRAELELRATRVRLQLGVRQTIDLVAR